LEQHFSLANARLLLRRRVLLVYLDIPSNCCCFVAFLLGGKEARFGAVPLFRMFFATGLSTIDIATSVGLFAEEPV